MSDTIEDRLEPYTEEWVKAWFDDPQRITRHLTPDERRNPRLNPMHPFATWPEGHEPARRGRL